MNKDDKVMISGGILKDKTVELYMESGNQVVNKEYIGNTPRNLRKVTIIKPDALAPANIRKDTNIGGVIGTHEEQIPMEKTVDLYMPKSNQVISTEGEYLEKLVVKKPDTMIPENIKLGIDIGGVVGECVPDEIDASKIQSKWTDPSAVAPVVVQPDTGYYMNQVTVNMIKASEERYGGDERPLQHMTQAIRSGYTVAGVVGSGIKYHVTTINVGSTTTDEDIKKEMKAHPNSYFIINVTANSNPNVSFLSNYIYMATSDGTIYEHKQLS